MEYAEFTTDPNLLVSVIKSQAGTLSKALLEGIMNSVDAGASSVKVTLSCDQFLIEDNGRGFRSEDEIRQWFGRFGTPHKADDATFGRFRMGRGQMMAFARTEWRSGHYSMTVDIENEGLRYGLTRHDDFVKGCRIEGKLYRTVPEYRFADLLNELKKYVAYMPKPVYVNGELFGAPASRLKSWTMEDEDAWYKVVQDSEELAVYNQGAFVENMGVYRIGMGGLVVTKKPLELNMARNSVMEDACPVWKRISLKLQALVLLKLSTAKKLSNGERKFLARRLSLLRQIPGVDWPAIKVMTDPSGKHLALRDLRNYKRFAYVDESESTACALHRENETFVVTDKLLTRFGYSTLQELLTYLRSLGGLIRDDVQIVTPDEIRKHGLGSSQEVSLDGLTLKEKAAFQTLQWLNKHLVDQLHLAGGSMALRELRAGRHERSSGFVAWTDGREYITVNKRYLKLLDRGVDGALEWVYTLVHEYMHDNDDSESHSHDEVFYRKFHDTVFGTQMLQAGQLAMRGLQHYLEALNQQGLSRPKSLRLQARGEGYVF